MHRPVSAAHASNDPANGARFYDTVSTPFNEVRRAAEPGVVVKTVKRHGAIFAIDRPIGHVKTGTGDDGKPFELTYTCDYGYLCKTHEDKDPPIGGDGMLIDAYCCAPTSRAANDEPDMDEPDMDEGDVDVPWIHVVNQVFPADQKPDEQKLIVGAKDAEHACRVYFAHTPSTRFGSMFSLDEKAFRTQLATATPGKRFAFTPTTPVAPDEPPPSSRGNRTRNVIPPRAASATVHAHQEPHAMPNAARPASPAHRDAGTGEEFSVIPELFTRVVQAERAYKRDVGGTERICVDFVMSTEAKDSHGTILRAEWDLKRFLQNPVFIYMHNRREDRPPIGVMENVRVEGKKLLGTACFDTTTEFDREIAQKYLNGTMRGGSVGFNPRSVTVEIIDGEETVVFADNELLEFSAACVPSNPDTIATQKARCLELGRAAGAIVRGAVPHRKFPLDNSTKWDAVAAEKRVRAWATKGDGKLDFGKYAQAFGWVDPAKANDVGGYKLLHHDVMGGRLVTVRGGVIAAGNAIQGARGGVNIPPSDLPAVKAHLAEHYKEFGLAPPWEKKKAHDNQTPTPTENTMLDLILRLADPTTDSASAGQRAHGAAPCEVTCPGCSETLRVVAELPASVAKTASELAETKATLGAAEARATTLETKLGARSKDVSNLLVKLAERDLSDLTGKKIDPAEVDTEMELARVYFSDEARDADGNLVGLQKWQTRVEKLKGRPDMKLDTRVVPPPKPGDQPTTPAAAAETKKDKDGRTHAGAESLTALKNFGKQA